ncbi:T9SS type A sorting domain-containing protein [Flavicella marina]|uniref:T9SS type A sorting domain-containing protein n=1 Tax=Flavicella marina TaxID=1475951 RepID=UPI001265575F|nr:T9SS type A sorting domain-containing protein [Flavicella marina]
MKKITLFSLLLVSTFSFAQTVTWNNKDTNVSPGEVIGLNITYDAGSGNTINYMHIVLTEMTAGWGNVQNYNATQVFANLGDPKNDSGTIDVNFTVDPTAPETTALTAGNFYLLRIYIEVTKPDTSKGYANGNTVVTLENATASINNIDGSSPISIYPNPVSDILYIDSDVTIDTYNVYSVSGQSVKSQKATGSIDVSDLQNGLYILNTGNRSTKFIKQ